MALPDLLDWLVLSSSSSASVVDKTSKRLLQFILDVSLLLFVLNALFDTIFWLQADYFERLDFYKGTV